MPNTCPPLSLVDDAALPTCLLLCPRGFAAPQGHSRPSGGGRTEAEAAGAGRAALPLPPLKVAPQVRFTGLRPASIGETKDRDDRGSLAGRHG